jgi:putative phosphoribosyl transferase
LARELAHYASAQDVVVLGLPRGGVPVAYEVARALEAPLDVFVVRKLGTPGRQELAMGALASGGVRVVNWDIVGSLDVPAAQLERVSATEKQELERREECYRGDRPGIEVNGQTAILVDDGLATGASMRAAVAALRRKQPARVVVAVPVAPPRACDELADAADEVVCPARPLPFFGVGAWYRDFHQISDQEVRELMERAETGAEATV